MANNSSTPDLDNLHLDDTDPDDLFASPGQPRDKKLDQNAALNADSKPRAPKTNYDDADNREAKLRQELENVRRVNKVIEDAVASLEKAKDNMDTVSRTVNNASTLLNTWTRILSQTEHNQRLILNPAWQGATQDLADIEDEALKRQQAAERREMEEQQRREAAMRKAEEEQRRSEAQAGKGVRGTRGSRRTTGSSRGTSSSTTSSRSGYVGVGGQGGRSARSTTGRSGSSIGRGTSSSRGRSRGVG